MSLRIAHVVAEFAGLAQTGGLADAVAALSQELARRGNDVRVFLPRYGLIDTRDLELSPVPEAQDMVIAFSSQEYSVSVSSLRLADAPVEMYFLECPEAYGGKVIYDQAGDEHLRFALLARAAIETCQRLEWAPDVFHCHDWHAGLLPLYLETLYDWDPLLAGARTVLTIHNLAYQGVFSGAAAAELGVDERAVEDGTAVDPHVNFLAAGIRMAGAVTTVSPTYGREIMTAEQGMGLEGELEKRGDRVIGILNGVDYAVWDPAHDPLIPANYSPDDLEGKAICRRELLAEAELDPAPSGPVLGIVSRLARQKGFEVLSDTMPSILENHDVRLVVLGTGEDEFEELFESLVSRFPAKAAFYRLFDPALAHRIEAGSDVFVMPSRFEPCGLNQMYSLRYGTPPIVHGVGGLVDTIVPFDPESGMGTGFVFAPFGSVPFGEALDQALEMFARPELWRRLVLNGMAEDFSWSRQVEPYLEMYRRLLGDPGS